MKIFYIHKNNAYWRCKNLFINSTPLGCFWRVSHGVLLKETGKVAQLPHGQTMEGKPQIHGVKRNNPHHYYGQYAKKAGYGGPLSPWKRLIIAV